MSVWLKYLCVMGWSALPVLELRMAVPWGIMNDLPLLPVLVVSIIGNMLPVPFIMKFVRIVFAWLKKKSTWLSRVIEKIEKRAEGKGDLIKKYEMWGLFVLVAIPLPGTGAWTGALVATLFDLRMKNAIPIIAAGVTVAGIIMSILMYGVDKLLMVF